MEYIKRYLYAIEKRLPSSMKSDVVKEIESLIMDELEGKYGIKQEYSDKEIQDVLSEMGHPWQVSARYRGGKQYIVGPDLYPFYQMVVAIVCGAVTLGLIISFFVGNLSIDVDVLSIIKDFVLLIPSIVMALITAVGSVTIVFALIQRFAKMDKKIGITEDWKVKDLPEIPQDMDKIKRVEPILGIFFTVVWAVFINLYAIYGNISFIPNAHSFDIVNIDMLNQVMPLINISIALTLILNILQIIQGQWSLSSRIIDLVESLVSITLLTVLLKSNMLLSRLGIEKMFEGSGLSLVNLEKYYYLSIKIILILSAIALVVKIVQFIIKVARKAGV